MSEGADLTALDPLHLVTAITQQLGSGLRIGLMLRNSSGIKSCLFTENIQSQASSCITSVAQRCRLVFWPIELDTRGSIDLDCMTGNCDMPHQVRKSQVVSTSAVVVALLHV